MHIISQRRLKEFWTLYPGAETALRTWHKLIDKGSYENFFKLRETFPSADKVENLFVFNIGGNKYRLIAYIDFQDQKLFIRHLLTHKEYDSDAWKDDTWNA
jgi:mRNA interferase HigB